MRPRRSPSPRSPLRSSAATRSTRLRATHAPPAPLRHPTRVNLTRQLPAMPPIGLLPPQLSAQRHRPERQHQAQRLPRRLPLRSVHRRWLRRSHGGERGRERRHVECDRSFSRLRPGPLVSASDCFLSASDCFSRLRPGPLVSARAHARPPPSGRVELSRAPERAPARRRAIARAAAPAEGRRPPVAPT